MQVIETSVDFADPKRWPNEENEASLLQRELITTSESPSSTNSVIPSSCAKTNALATAMAKGLVLTPRQSHVLDYHERPLPVQPCPTLEKWLHRNSV